MAVIEARLRVRHPCPYCDLSVRYPEVLLLLWCDNRRDVFLVSAPDADRLRRVLRELRTSFHARPIVRAEGSALVVVPDYEWPDPPSVTRIARTMGLWVVPPVVYADGRETYRLVASSRGLLARLVRRLRALGPVEVLSIAHRAGLETVREISTLSVHLFEGLTERQADALLAAHEGGLWQIPSLRPWAEVARGQGLSRATFGEHLRKAQHRLLANSYSTLRAHREAMRPPVLLPSLGRESAVRASTPRAGQRRRAGRRRKAGESLT